MNLDPYLEDVIPQAQTAKMTRTKMRTRTKKRMRMRMRRRMRRRLGVQDLVEIREFTATSCLAKTCILMLRSACCP